MENFLLEKHAEQYTGLDDEMSDDAVDWIGNLDVQEVIEYADEYLKQEKKLIIERIEVAERLQRHAPNDDANKGFNKALENVKLLIK